MGGGQVVPFARPGPDPLEGDVGVVVDRPVGVPLGDAVGEVAVDRLAVGDPVGADDAGVADVGRAGVGHVEADPEPHQEQCGDEDPGHRPDRRQPLPPAAKPDPEGAAEEVEQDRVLQRHRDADLAAVEEDVGNAEGQQDEQVEVGDPPPTAPVDQAEQEDRAERQEDVRCVELVAELAGVAAGHLPGHLVPGPGLRDFAALTVDQNQRHLLAVGEVSNLPDAVVVDAGAVAQRSVPRLLLGDVRVTVGSRDRLRFGDLPGSRGSLRRHPPNGEEEKAATDSTDRAGRGWVFENGRPRPPAGHPPSAGSTARASVLEHPTHPVHTPKARIT